MYDEILYHCDLSIMAYHLYAQALVWPWDPFYEQMRNVGSERRNNFMKGVRTLIRQSKTYNNIDCMDWLDPIPNDYARINPTKSCLFRGSKDGWELFTPIPEIVGSIQNSYFVKNQTVPLGPTKIYNANGTDTIYYFEGETGIVNGGPNEGQKSILGFILVRQYEPNDPTKYDIHLAFRGSRSGNAGKAFGEAKFTKGGNPDWVTDLQASTLIIDGEICFKGKIPNGFAFALKSAIPNILSCLKHIQLQRQTSPRNFFVTGHSLGGALAGLFASAINANWANNQVGILGWENTVRRIVVLTYGCPVFGDEEMINYYNRYIYCRRIKVNLDPVTTDSRAIVSRGIHAGILIETTSNKGTSLFDNHRYDIIREKIIFEFMGLLPIPITKPNISYSKFSKIPMTEYNGQKCQLQNYTVSSPGFWYDFDTYFKLYSDTLSAKENYSASFVQSKIEERKKYLAKIKNFIKGNTNITEVALSNMLKLNKDDEIYSFILLCFVLNKINIVLILVIHPKLLIF